MQLKMVSSHKKKRTPFTNNNQTILPHDGKRKKAVVQQTNWYAHLKQRHWFSEPLYQTGKKQELPGLRKNPQRRIWAIHFLCHAGEVQRLSDTPQQGGKSQSKTDRLSNGAGTGGSRNWKAAGYADRPMRLCLPMATEKFEEPDTRRQTISKAIAELLYIMLNSWKYFLCVLQVIFSIYF